MTPAELVAASVSGTALILQENVTNPAPDRRVTSDWRMSAVIPAGTRFYVQVDLSTKALHVYKAGEYSFKDVMYRPDGTAITRHHGSASPKHDLAAALLPALGWDKRTLGSVAAKYHTDPDCAAVTIVGKLLKSGRLNMNEIDAILAEDGKDEES